MKNRRIGIDFDSTIFDSSRMIVELYNYVFNANKKFFNCSWNFEGIFEPDELPTALSLFNNPNQYKFSKMIDGSLNSIFELSKYNDVFIVTKQDEERRPITLDFVKKMFGNNVNVIFTDSFDKSSFGECDLFIDDKIECLDSMDGFAEHRLCFGNYDWNKDWTGDKALNWNEVMDYCKKNKLLQ